MPDPVDILVRGKDLNNQLSGPGSAWVNELPQYARRVEARTVGVVTTFYTGWALYGSAEGDPVWMVTQLVLDETTLLDVTEGIAGGAPGKAAFAYSWTDRASHTYS